MTLSPEQRADAERLNPRMRIRRPTHPDAKGGWLVLTLDPHDFRPGLVEHSRGRIYLTDEETALQVEVMRVRNEWADGIAAKSRSEEGWAA